WYGTWSGGVNDAGRPGRAAGQPDGEGTPSRRRGSPRGSAPMAEVTTPPMPLDADGPLPGEREEFLRAVRHRFRRAAPELPRWSRAVRVEERGPLDFATFPFQPELYEAFGDRGQATVDVMKSAQCGISAAAISHALHAADIWEAS